MTTNDGTAPGTPLRGSGDEWRAQVTDTVTRLGVPPEWPASTHDGIRLQGVDGHLFSLAAVLNAIAVKLEKLEAAAASASEEAVPPSPADRARMVDALRNMMAARLGVSVGKIQMQRMRIGEGGEVISLDESEIADGPGNLQATVCTTDDCPVHGKDANGRPLVLDVAVTDYTAVHAADEESGRLAAGFVAACNIIGLDATDIGEDGTVEFCVTGPLEKFFRLSLETGWPEITRDWLQEKLGRRFGPALDDVSPVFKLYQAYVAGDKERKTCSTPSSMSPGGASSAVLVG